MLMNASAAARRALSILAVACFSQTLAPQITHAQGNIRTDNPVLGSLETALGDLVTRLGRSIVTVEIFPHNQHATGVMDKIPMARPLDGSNGRICSGVIVDTGGLVLTTAPFEQLDGEFVIAYEGKRYPAQLIGIDYVESIALLRAPGLVGTVAQISQAQLCTGQMVLALGTAMGIRSAPSLGFCAGYRGDGTLQTSTPYSDTYAGGALFDLSGRLYGLMTGRELDAAPFALAVPAYRIRTSIEMLRASGDRDAGFLGMGGRSVRFGLRGNRNQLLTGSASTQGTSDIRTGLLVGVVDPASPGAQAGLQPGDLITDFGTAPVSDQDAFSRVVRLMQPGSVAPMTIIRGEMVLTLMVPVGSRKEIFRNASAQPSAVDGAPSDSLLSIFLSMQKQLDQLQQQLFRRQ